MEFSVREWKVELHFLIFNINSQFSVYFYSFLCVWDSILTTWNSFPGVLNRFRLWPLYGLTLRSEAWEEGGCYNQLSLFWFQCLDPIIVGGKIYSEFRVNMIPFHLCVTVFARDQTRDLQSGEGLPERYSMHLNINESNPGLLLHSTKNYFDKLYVTT